ncbi:MAG TPA: hypothetical protein VN175_13590 [Rhizomicrobium sp.]|nr:hypothetical protein [Rhizomicrobium sp.]
MAARKKRKTGAAKKKAVKAKKTSRKTAKKPKKAAARKSVKAAARKATAKKAKAAPKKKAKRKTIGEGNYAASRRFDKDEVAFVKKNKARIPAMGKEAEKALEGPEGAALRDAEATAAARSRDIF